MKNYWSSNIVGKNQNGTGLSTRKKKDIRLKEITSTDGKGKGKWEGKRRGLITYPLKPEVHLSELTTFDPFLFRQCLNYETDILYILFSVIDKVSLIYYYLVLFKYQIL